MNFLKELFSGYASITGQFIYICVLEIGIVTT